MIMRKIFYLAVCIGLLATTACSKDDSPSSSKVRRRTLTFEETSYNSNDIENPDGTITSNWWSSRIDSPQYGGPLLYSGNGYSWYDSETDLFSTLPDPWGDKTFFGGGVAISNYIYSPTVVTYEEQLTTNIKAIDGRSNTNFAVCYVASNDCPPFIEFKYGTGVVEQMFIFNTEYPEYVVKNGNDFVSPLPSSGYIKLVITGVDRDRNVTGSIDVYLFEGQNGISVKRVDTSVLGKVKRLEFRIIEGEVVNGLRVDSTAEYNNYPAYFAFDNVTVLR